MPEEKDGIMLGVPGWKKRYFEHKFPGVDEEGQTGVAAAYVEGLCWVMRYYYDGCASWTWFYPYHYAPFAADIADAMDEEVVHYACNALWNALWNVECTMECTV